MFEKRSFVINNCNIITPFSVIMKGSLEVLNGIISRVDESSINSNELPKIDADGFYVFPGIIDLHSDVIEKKIQPRPNAFFPYDIAIYELDKEMLSCGITTIFHSLSFAGMDTGPRSNLVVKEIIKSINTFSKKLCARTKIHARYEVTDYDALPIIEELVKAKEINLISLMDHTPGQGQFKELTSFKAFYGRSYCQAERELEILIDKRLKAKETLREESLIDLIKLCKYYDIPIASHDDDSVEKIKWLCEKGIRITEFPVNKEAIEEANKRKIFICLGAPNIIRGYSHVGNLSAREAIEQGFGDIICSDYSPYASFHSIFTLYEKEILPLNKAVNMVSLNPARAVGLEGITGSIEVGKCADLIIVDIGSTVPRIIKTFVCGKEVFSSC